MQSFEGAKKSIMVNLKRPITHNSNSINTVVLQVKKFMVGYEMLAQGQRDLTAEQVRDEHWRQRTF